MIFKVPSKLLRFCDKLQPKHVPVFNKAGQSVWTHLFIPTLASLPKHSRLFCCPVMQAIPFVSAEWRDVQASSMWEHPFLQPVFTIFSQFFKQVPFMSQWMTNCLDSLPMQARLDARGKLSSRDSPSHVLLKTQGRSWCSHLFHKQQGKRHIYSIVSVHSSSVLQCYTTLPFPAWQAAALWWDFSSQHTSSFSLNKASGRWMAALRNCSWNLIYSGCQAEAN